MEKKLLKRFEEMDDKERDKLKELLKDSSKRDGEEKLSWMYKDKADSEEFLLGRRVDTGVLQPETSDKDTPGALFSEVITRRSELDMQVKMREDPLYAIRKKEEEVKRRLLENPIKMKQLQKAVEKQSKDSKHKDKKKKKKHKKSRSSSSDDDELLHKYLAIVGHKKSKDTKGTNDEQDLTRDRLVRKSSTRSGEDRVRRRSGDRDVDERDRRPMAETGGDKRRHKDCEELSADEEVISRSYEDKRRRYGLIVSNSRTLSRPTTSSIESSKHNTEIPSGQTTAKSMEKSLPMKTVRRKLTAEEMEQKRAEMMANARERDEQRQHNVKRYRDEDEREKKLTAEQRHASFVKPLMVKHAAESSVEDRIKRNLYNIQRTNSDLDKNFTKR
jgi:hypothetical protein